MASPPDTRRPAPRARARRVAEALSPLIGAIVATHLADLDDRVRGAVCDAVDAHLDGALSALQRLDAAVAGLEARCDALEAAAGGAPYGGPPPAVEPFGALVAAILDAYTEADDDIIFHLHDDVECRCIGPACRFQALFGGVPGAVETLRRHHRELRVELLERGIGLHRYVCDGAILFVATAAPKC